ncbi:hypothetical protein CEXT_651001 [Caerostris extrusa]|uniref:Uncharacterized protein n=1 Tax=Caerostris extrusa TaxID=172846 RepID=A0AAV4XZZ4_CAEEX|nr:hypothetical protein CEXT_651001 [Caerostris extrusa]
MFDEKALKVLQRCPLICIWEKISGKVLNSTPGNFQQYILIKLLHYVVHGSQMTGILSKAVYSQHLWLDSSNRFNVAQGTSKGR